MAKLVSVIAVVVVAFLVATDPVVAQAARQVTGHQIKNGSVTGKDLKDHSVKAADLADGSVTGAAVSDHSLTGADIDTGSLPVVHHVVVRQVNGPIQTVGVGNTLQTTATCLPGETIVGGGAYTSTPGLAVYQSWPATDSNRWIVAASNTTGAPLSSGQVIAYASCAS